MLDGAKCIRGGVAVAIALLGAACGSDDTAGAAASSSGGPPAACGPGERADSKGSCLAAGTQDDGCAAGEHAVGDECRPAGVPADGCGAGFEPTDDHGCDPILPDAKCMPGEMAVPGETACRALADCGAGPWGDEPTDGDTKFVDASYPGPSSDGTNTSPYKTIQEAIDAAGAGAVVAVAAGSYAENLVVVGKPVVIRGRCPEMVEIVGGDPAAIEIGVGATATHVTTLAIRGSAIGIAVTGASDVVADRVWIHDTAQAALYVENLFAPSSALLEGSLVDGAGQLAIFVRAASATVEASVVRDTAEAGAVGDALWAEGSAGVRAALTVKGSLVEGAHEAGVYGKMADVTVEDSVIREIAPTTADGIFGDAVGGEEDAIVRIKRSVLADTHDAAVYALGADVIVESSVIRDTEPAADGMFGRGINVEPTADGKPSTLTVIESVIESSTATGIYVGGATAAIDSSIIRGTRSSKAEGFFGMGISTVGGISTTVRWSVLDDNRDTAFYIQGGEGRVEGTVVSGTKGRAADLTFGRGIEADPMIDPFAATKLEVIGCRVLHNADFGVYVGASEATVDATLIDDTLPRESDKYFGRGVGVEALFGYTGKVTIAHSVIARSHDFGMYVLDSAATVDSVLITGTSPDGDGNFGDGLGLTRFATFGVAELEVSGSRVEKSKRAGITAFAGHTVIQGTTLDCNPIPLDGETYQGHDPVFDDLGGNVCGCGGTEVACAILSATLAPPKPAEEHGKN